MRNFSLALSLFMLVLLFIGCGGSKQPLQSASQGDTPEWYLSKPEDPNSLFETATATSQDLQLAVDKAVQAARTNLARQVELKVQALQKRFQEETGLGQDSQLLDQFTQASKTVTSATLSGSKVKKQQPMKDGSIWRAYVLIEYPLGAAQEALRAQIKKNEQLYTKVRASEVYKELDDSVEKYEQSKK